MALLLLIVFLCLAVWVAASIWRTFFRGRARRHHKAKHHIERSHKNPIIAPRKNNYWESEATFNPAAVKIGDKVHIVYRALGGDGVSRFGHAAGTDGEHFPERSPFPVFQPSDEAMKFDPDKMPGLKEYNPGLYASGGGWGGAEDPRLVKIGDNIYMTYTEFQNWDSVRISLTSIKADDMKRGIWNWKKPVHISPPKEVHKNWVLFPEKIKGKFAILHGISPKISVDYVDDLDLAFQGKNFIKSHPPKGGRQGFWDNWMRGAGAPPIKTALGWLLLYHAMDKKDPNKYKLGAMVLDEADPTKVLYRSPHPILEPDMHYENDWKPGVVYASGALIMGDNLNIYYGGGDKTVCVATTPLEKLLNWLRNYGGQELALAPVRI